MVKRREPGDESALTGAVAVPDTLSRVRWVGRLVGWFIRVSKTSLADGYARAEAWNIDDLDSARAMGRSRRGGYRVLPRGLRREGAARSRERRGDRGAVGRR